MVSQLMTHYGPSSPRKSVKQTTLLYLLSQVSVTLISVNGYLSFISLLKCAPVFPLIC